MDLLKVGIDWFDVNLWIGAVLLGLTPAFWSIVGRLEYKSHFLTKLFGDAKVACTAFAVVLISVTLYKTYRYKMAMDSQPRCTVLQENWILWLGYCCLYTGMLLVISSFLALGFFGTYLGDYFGILMDEKVTGFPFNFLDNPMYVGSVINYMGMAFIRASSAGVFMTVLSTIGYYVAITYEGPFTEEIYRNRNKSKTS